MPAPTEPEGLDGHRPAVVEPGAIGLGQWDVLAATAVGGIIGAEARYGLSVVVHHRPAQFPWSTLLINVSGCFLIGVLMFLVLEVVPARGSFGRLWGNRGLGGRLARPFLGVGVLGGYTTFSTFAVDVERLIRLDRLAVAGSYLLLTVVLGAVSVRLGNFVARLGQRRLSSDQQDARLHSGRS